MVGGRRRPPGGGGEQPNQRNVILASYWHLRLTIFCSGSSSLGLPISNNAIYSMVFRGRPLPITHLQPIKPRPSDRLSTGITHSLRVQHGLPVGFRYQPRGSEG